MTESQVARSRMFTLTHPHRTLISSGLVWLLLTLTGCAWLPTAEDIVEDTKKVPQEFLIQKDGKVLTGQQIDQYLSALLQPLPEPTAMRDHMLAEQTVSGFPLVDGNSARLLIDGPQTYEAMFSAIRRARHHVHLNAYIFSDDGIGEQLAELLTARSRAGIHVRIIHDAFGSLETPAAFFADMQAQGVEIVTFNPLNPVEDLRLWRINHREHAKLLVVDGAIAFTGGLNISSVYLDSGSSSSGGLSHSGQARGPGAWRDTHLQLEGPIVAYLQTRFLDSWKSITGKEIENREEYLLSLPRRGDTAVRVLDSPADNAQLEAYTLYLSAITHARQRLWLTQSYFSPNEEILAALEAAAHRGVDVQILVPGITDQGLVYHASRSKYGRLLKAGVKLWEFQDRVLHAKTAVVDGIWSTIGSANLDIRSFIHNNELNVSLVSPQFAQQLENQFRKDLDTAAAVSLQDWEARSFSDRLKEFGARLLDYWL